MEVFRIETRISQGAEGSKDIRLVIQSPDLENPKIYWLKTGKKGKLCPRGKKQTR
jgi:hypothetical protein